MGFKFVKKWSYKIELKWLKNTEKDKMTDMCLLFICITFLSESLSFRKLENHSLYDNSNIEDFHFHRQFPLAHRQKKD
jgi:hypothetical protein